MAIEAFIPQARQEMKERTSERLARQITDITGWLDSQASLSLEDQASLSSRAELVSRTAEEIDALSSTMLVAQESKSIRVEGEFRGSWVILYRHESGDKSTFSGVQNSDELSAECAEQAWYLYGQPIVNAQSRAKFLENSTKK